MMTIDEAIKHAEDKAKELKRHAESWKHSSEQCETEFVRNKATEMSNRCLACSDDHLQLAEWLKELKTRKAEDNSGEWLAEGKDYVQCSHCKEWFKKRYLPYGNYCCKCGAKMTEGIRYETIACNSGS